MEIGENDEIIKSIHSVQSVPILSSAAAEANKKDESDGASRKNSKNRRVSFANSTQLARVCLNGASARDENLYLLFYFSVSRAHQLA